MFDPDATIKRLLETLTESDQDQDHQRALIDNEPAIQRVKEFAGLITETAIKRVAIQGVDLGAALRIGSEASIVAVLLLGVEYGRLLERDQVRSLEQILEDFGGMDG